MKKNIFILSFLLGCSIAAFSQSGTKKHQEKSKPQKIVLKEKDLASPNDPVCGMNAFQYLKDTAVVNKRIYGFCSPMCKQAFKAKPGKYLKK